MIDAVCVQGKKVDMDLARRMASQFEVDVISEIPKDKYAKYLLLDKNGVSFVSGGKALKGDFTNMLPRVTGGHLQHEIILKAVGQNTPENARIIDATAGLGDDSFVLAAAGYQVEMIEHNPITAILLQDSLQRAKRNSLLKDIAKNMTLRKGDSKEILTSLNYSPDVIYLDPMFPEKKKSAETKKKFQVLHTIEWPCTDENELIAAAMAAKPGKIVIKRPPEGPFLGGIKPTYSVKRKAIRFDCLECGGR